MNMNETKKRAAENPTENKKQAEAQIVVPVVRTVVVPFAYSAVVRVVVPTAAAFDLTRHLIRSIPFLTKKFSSR